MLFPKVGFINNTRMKNKLHPTTEVQVTRVMFGRAGLAPGQGHVWQYSTAPCRASCTTAPLSIAHMLLDCHLHCTAASCKFHSKLCLHNTVQYSLNNLLNDAECLTCAAASQPLSGCSWGCAQWKQIPRHQSCIKQTEQRRVALENTMGFQPAGFRLL
jgi:hypothetical protein